MTCHLFQYTYMQRYACQGVTMVVAVLLQECVTAFNTIVDLNAKNVSFINNIIIVSHYVFYFS